MCVVPFALLYMNPSLSPKKTTKKKDNRLWQKKAVDIIKRTQNEGTRVKDFASLVKNNQSTINQTDENISTILHEVAKLQKGQDFIEVLSTYNCDFRAQDCVDNTPLLWSIANGCNETAKKILEYTPISQINSLDKRGWTSNTPLHLLVAKGYTTETMDGAHLTVSNLELMGSIIGKGADVNLKNEDGNTPLHLACAKRDVEMVRLLIQNEANPTFRNIMGQTPQDMLELGYFKAKKLMYSTASAYLLPISNFIPSTHKICTLLLCDKAIRQA